MINLHSLFNLHADFNQYDYGIGDNLIHYFAHPRIPLPTFDFAAAVDAFTKRQHPDDMNQLKMAPQDVSIFRKRAGLLATDNRAYYIATHRDPTTLQLEEFSLIQPCWSTLFPLKHFLMHHPKQAKEYKGLLPYGSEVVKYVNVKIKTKPHNIPTSPDYSDHVFLQHITNEMSEFTGISTVEINNMMYLQGRHIDDKVNASA